MNLSLPIILFSLIIICDATDSSKGRRRSWNQVFPGFPAIIVQSRKSCILKFKLIRHETIPEVYGQRGDGEPVYLNIYKLRLGRMDGLGYGLYHSAVQVYGVQYEYGVSKKGIKRLNIAGEPKTAAKRFKKLKMSILIGYTKMNFTEVEEWISKLQTSEFSIYKYNLTHHNCNHFSDAFMIILTGKGIPKWVNRLAFLADCMRFQRTEMAKWKRNPFTS